MAGVAIIASIVLLAFESFLFPRFFVTSFLFLAQLVKINARFLEENFENDEIKDDLKRLCSDSDERLNIMMQILLASTINENQFEKIVYMNQDGNFEEFCTYLKSFVQRITR